MIGEVSLLAFKYVSSLTCSKLNSKLLLLKISTLISLAPIAFLALSLVGALPSNVFSFNSLIVALYISSYDLNTISSNFSTLPGVLTLSIQDDFCVAKISRNFLSLI